ncbi:MAG: hypothetical protein NVSMB29_04580 [Candidatus Dormibacteria bacterium]
MPVILRWLLIDLAINRVLRRRRMAGYGATRPMLMGRYPRRYAVPATFILRRPLLGCGTGCAAMLGLSLLVTLLLTALANITISIP